MENLRDTMELLLSDTLEGDYGTPCELISPQGAVYGTSRNSPNPLAPLPLRGQFITETVRREDQVDTERYGFIKPDKPVLSLRTSSLYRVPKDGELWVVRILTNPPQQYIMEGPPVNGDVYGFIKLYLKKAK